MSPRVHPSALQLDACEWKLAAEDQLVEVRQHVSSCLSCQEKLRTRRQWRQHFDSAVFPRSADRIGMRSTPRRGRIWLAAPALAAATIIVAIVSRRPPAQTVRELSVKGGPALEVFVRREDHAVRVNDGDVLRPRDRLRFVVDSAALRYLLIASVDGAGKVTVYFPFQGAASGPVGDPSRWQVPGSIELDDTPGPERIFALYSRTPISAESVARALSELARGGSLAIRQAHKLPIAKAAQATVLFEKPPH
jgi:hypothetical protein